MRFIEVTRLLGILLSEVEQTATAAAGTRLRRERYEPYLQKVRHALYPGRIHQEWNNVAQFLSSETLLSLGTLADSIDEHERSVPFDQIESLLSQVTELENEVRCASDLSEELRTFVCSQLDTIRKAMRDYSFQGAAAIARAFERAVWEWNHDHVRPRTAPERKATAKLRILWRTAVALATFAGGVAIKADATAASVTRLLDRIPDVVRRLSDLAALARSEPRQLPPGTTEPDAE